MESLRLPARNILGRCSMADGDPYCHLDIVTVRDQQVGVFVQNITNESKKKERQLHDGFRNTIRNIF